MLDETTGGRFDVVGGYYEGGVSGVGEGLFGEGDAGVGVYGAGADNYADVVVLASASVKGVGKNVKRKTVDLPIRSLTLSLISSFVILRTSPLSSMVIVAASPVVPKTHRPAVPSATCHWRSLRYDFSSISPLGSMGVARATVEPGFRAEREVGVKGRGGRSVKAGSVAGRESEKAMEVRIEREGG